MYTVFGELNDDDVDYDYDDDVFDFDSSTVSNTK